MKYKDDGVVLEYQGKLYRNYAALLDAITDYGETLEGWDADYLYSMERWIVTQVLKFDVAERKIK